MTLPRIPSFTRFLWLTAASALLFLGCPPTYPKCNSDEQCTEKGEVCVNGMCQECATDANCKEGFVCQENRCVPKPECTDDSGCPEGTRCSGGKCVAAVKAECTQNADCPGGQECMEGRCVAATARQCTYDSVHFDFNEYNLSSAAQSALAAYAECMKNAGNRFTLEGYADERGTEEYNLALSQKRAASVRKYLVDLGVAGGALETVGFGENKPIDSRSTEEAWAANRRVEFKQR